MSFDKFSQQLIQDLQSLSSESKRRYSNIRQASDKSLEILRNIQEFGELKKYPDFVMPFILSCQSGNAKMTSIAIQCLQRLVSSPSIPEDKIELILNSLIDATKLAVEIQLKVLQIIPIFFKSYGVYITGNLCAKLLSCCSVLFQHPAKTPIVTGTASATLQQLINDIFERSKKDLSEAEIMLFDVPINNSGTISVNQFEYDTNRVLTDISSIIDSDVYKYTLLDIQCISEDYDLEILESLFLNHKTLFIQKIDLQFLLRTKVVPLLLRLLSSSKQFSTVVRTCRCIQLLINNDFLSILELELEVILSLLIYSLSSDSDSPSWKKILSLEIFLNVINFELMRNIFKTYDSFEDRRNILGSFLKAMNTLINQLENKNSSKSASILSWGDISIISQEASVPKFQFIDLLDKSKAPTIDSSYMFYLILTISNTISATLDTHIVSIFQSDNCEKDKTETIKIFETLFPELYILQKNFLCSSTLEAGFFHSSIRSFQKLGHGAGLLSLFECLDQCLNTFFLEAVDNVNIQKEFLRANLEDEETQQSTILTTLGETLINTHVQPVTAISAPDNNIFHPRIFRQKNLSVFRALVSLTISLRSVMTNETWKYFFLAWQWCSYYVYGPSQDFINTNFSKKIPLAEGLTKYDTTTIENTIKRFFENTTTYSNASFDILLRSLISESNKSIELPDHVLSDSHGLHPVTTKYGLQNCIYNRSFFITQIGELSKYNHARFINEGKGKDIWKSMIDYLICLITSRTILNNSLRLYTTNTFTGIITQFAIEASRVSETEVLKFDIIEDQLLRSLMKLIDGIMCLGITKKDIYDGIVNIESDILFQGLGTLKDLLDHFGDYFKNSWPIVFRIINSPFEIIGKGYELEQDEDKNDVALVELVFEKHKDMVQMSFEVFKLISDDFLQTLPLSIIKNVIDTLLNFSMQEKDLNISFSAISQFWLVGDYLRVISSSVNTHENGDTTEPIDTETAESMNFYYDLWLYLLRTLVTCTKDNRLEVRKGAIRTLFRIIDSHAACFPSWDLVTVNAIEPLLSRDIQDLNLDESSEFLDITLQGLIQIYPLYLNCFDNLEKSLSDWSLLLNYMKKLQDEDLPLTKFVVFDNFNRLLVTLNEIEKLPNELINNCYELWEGYNIVYTYATKSSHEHKSNFECLEVLIKCYNPLYKLMIKNNLVTKKFIESSVAIFNSVVRFPILPEFVSDKNKPSSLQKAVLDALCVFELEQDPWIELILINQLSSIVSLPFETRDRIKKKLSAKLGDSFQSRIPTFNAVSYKASKILLSRIGHNTHLRKISTDSNLLIKILTHLFEPIRFKCMVTITEEDDRPLWVLSSLSFFSISSQIFESMSTSSFSNIACSDVQDQFLEIFIRNLSTYLIKVGPGTDQVTEEYDICEYSKNCKLLLKYINITSITEEKLKPFVSMLWSNSFFYDMNTTENDIIKNDFESLIQTTMNLCNFDFDSIPGSTREIPILSKYKSAFICIDDLIVFSCLNNSGSLKLRHLATPFFISRVAFTLRRYISDEYLMKRLPISKVRKLELLKLINGLLTIMKTHISEHFMEFKNDFKILYPLLIKAISVSYKVDGLQDYLQQVCLLFNELEE